MRISLLFSFPRPLFVQRGLCGIYRVSYKSGDTVTTVPSRLPQGRETKKLVVSGNRVKTSRKFYERNAPRRLKSKQERIDVFILFSDGNL